MSRLEEYAATIAEGLDLSAKDRKRIREEAIAHLEDETARLVAAGKEREEAEALAIEAFGSGGAIAALVDEALAGRQNRHKRASAIRSAAAVAGLLLLAFAGGPIFILQDSQLWRRLTRGPYGSVYEVSMFCAVMVCLTIIAWRLARTRKGVASASGCVAVFSFLVAVLVACYLEWLIEACGWEGSTVPPGFRVGTVIFLGWPVAAALVGRMLGRVWPQVKLVVWSLAMGLGFMVSGLFAHPSGDQLASSVLVGALMLGFMALEYVLVTWMLAGAVERYEQRRATSAPAPQCEG